MNYKDVPLAVGVSAVNIIHCVPMPNGQCFTMLAHCVSCLHVCSVWIQKGVNMPATHRTYRSPSVTAAFWEPDTNYAINGSTADPIQQLSALCGLLMS